jgi:hypothetical protein
MTGRLSAVYPMRARLINLPIVSSSHKNAILAAMSTHWRSGQREVNINRSETVKRQFYGRAAPNLLQGSMIFSVQTTWTTPRPQFREAYRTRADKSTEVARTVPCFRDDESDYCEVPMRLGNWSKVACRPSGNSTSGDQPRYF